MTAPGPPRGGLTTVGTRVPVEGDRRLYVHRCGDTDGRPVVLIHGGAMSSRNWDSLRPHLVAAGRHVVSFDMRACGSSDRDFAGMDVATLGADVVKVMDALNIDSAAVIGWSIGGAVAVEAAHLLGPRLERLVVIDGATPRLLEDTGYPGLPPAAFDAVAQALAEDRAAFWRGMSSILFHQPRPDIAEQYWRLFMCSGTAFDATLTSLEKLDQRNILPDITAPVLVCHGRHDLYMPLMFGESLAAGLPNAELLIFENSGHAPFLEEPETFCAHVLAFLGSRH